MAKEPELVQPKIKGESTDKEHKDCVRIMYRCVHIAPLSLVTP